MASKALDGLRGLSAQAVLVAHVGSVLLPGLDPRALQALGWTARIAVIVFFCLSGFVIASSILRSRAKGGFSFADYGLRRVARIMPPYLLAIATSYLACWPGGALPGVPIVPAVPSPVEVGRALLFLNTGADILTRMNGPLWSLRLEVIAYVVAGCVALVLQRRGRLDLVTLLAAAMAGALVLGSGYALSFGFVALVWFGLGALAATGWLDRVERFGLPAAVLIYLGGLLLLGEGAFEIGAADSVPAATMQLVFAAAIAAWIRKLSRQAGSFLDRFNPLARFAYTLYVVHMPLLMLIAARVSGAGSSHESTVAFGVAVGGAMAIVFFAGLAARLVEQPRVVYELLRRMSRPIG